MGEPITRPLKVEEGLLLSVLEVAASHGHVELAEAAWRVSPAFLPLFWGGGCALLVVAGLLSSWARGGRVAWVCGVRGSSSVCAAVRRPAR